MPKSLDGNIPQGIHTGRVHGFLISLHTWVSEREGLGSPFKKHNQPYLTLSQVLLIKGPEPSGGIFSEIQSLKMFWELETSIQVAHNSQPQWLH